MTRIDICIATRRRPGMLRALLSSIERQRLPADLQYRVIVADNDSLQQARPVAEEFLARGLPLTYDSVEEPNISLARNLAFRHSQADWIATIDDDSEAARDWLEQLYKTAVVYQADVVFGAVERKLPEGTPRYLADSGIFRGHDPPTGTTEGLVYLTGNCLFRRSAVAHRDEPFSLEYGVTGGEDTELFHELKTQHGARIVWCREAHVVETVLPECANLAWRLRRAFREGANYAHIHGRWRALPDAPFRIRCRRLYTFIARPCAEVAVRLLLSPVHYPSLLKAVRGVKELVFEAGSGSAHCLGVRPRRAVQ